MPQPLLLGFITFLLSFVPAAPPLVWGSLALWLFFQGEFGWSIAVAGWSLLFVSSIDNLSRPYLITQANSLPVLLSFFGFRGGILAFGFIGVFLGPVLLAVDGRRPTRTRGSLLLIDLPAEVACRSQLGVKTMWEAAVLAASYIVDCYR